ncbi:MAG: EAL domain-containing protein [Pseudomonadota bacterium]
MDKLLARLRNGKWQCPLRRWHGGLVIKVAGSMLVAGMALALVFALASTMLIHEHETRRQLERIDELLSTVENTLRIACFTGDPVLAEEVTRGLLTNRMVVGVDLSARDKVLASSSREGHEANMDHAVRRPVTSPFDEGLKIGEITLLLDHAYIQAMAREQAWLIVALLLIEALALGLLLVRGMLRTVVGPIQRLAAEIDAIPAGARASLLSAHGDDDNEIKRLATSFNTLLDRNADLLDTEQSMRQRIAESERQLHSLAENLPCLMSRHDRHGAFVYVNSQFEKAMGLCLADIRGKRPTEIPRLPEAELLEDKIRSIAQNGIAEEFEIRIRSAAGIQWLLVQMLPEHDENGDIASILVVSRDVSARKITERNLVETRNRLMGVLHNIPDLVWLKDPQGVYLACNTAFERLYGAPEGEIVGKSDDDFVEREQAEHFRKMDRLAMVKDHIHINEEWVTFAEDGRRALLETRKIPVRDAEGEIAGVLGIARDITARKTAERQLKLLEHAINASGDAIFVTDLQGAFVYVNDTACYSLGYSRSELLRMGVLDINPEASAERIRQISQELLANSAITSFETVHRTKDGHVFPVEIAKSLMEFDGAHFGISVARDITERKTAEQRFTHLATHDALTGLPNRTLLKDRLQLAIAQAHRAQEQLAIIFIDLDNFKVINDTLGHDVGDELLKQVAVRMQGALREGDTVARLGGDEFVVLIPGGDRRSLEHVADKLLTALSLAYDIASRQLYSGASMGIAIYPRDGEDMDTLMRNADTAMYAAKSQGRNKYRFFSAKMDAEIQEWSRLSHSLHQALQRKEFELHYQPKIDLSSGAITGLEALIRWRHPEWGMVSPARFIPVAEKNGLINEIGLWVMDEACRQMRAWLDRGVEPGRMAINLSGQQCQGSDLPRQIRAALQRHRLDGARLEVEITESIVMSDTEESVHAFWALRDLGVSVAVDDFGTGYSSLSYLKRLPVNTLKIDKSFVDDIQIDPQDQEIIRAILAMAQSLGLNVVAEGIETGEQLALLREAGCPEGQGYYFSKPQPAQEITALLLADASHAAPANGDNVPGLPARPRECARIPS